jgi:hypothetical protein
MRRVLFLRYAAPAVMHYIIAALPHSRTAITVQRAGQGPAT